MTNYKITETIIYCVEADSEEEAWKVFETTNFDKADALKVYRGIGEF